MIFSYKAQACLLSQRALGERDRVNTNLEFIFIYADEVGEFVRPGLDECVVVFVEGEVGYIGHVCGDFRLCCLGRAVIESCAYYGLGAVEQFGGVNSLLEIFVHVAHLGGVAGIQPAA